MFTGALTGNRGTVIAARLTSIASGWEADWYLRNLFVLSTSINIDYDDDLCFLFEGDSFTVQGGNSARMGDTGSNAGTLAAWVTRTPDATGTDIGNGFLNSGSDAASAAVASDTQDASYISTVFRVLAKLASPIRPSGANTTAGVNANYAESGATLARVAVSHAQAQASNIEHTTVFLGIGTTEAAAGTVDPADFLSDYKSQLDEYIDVDGVDSVIIWTILSLTNDPAFDNPTSKAFTDSLNAQIRTLRGYRGKVKVYDAFSDITPNHVVDTEDFKSANLHPSGQGQNKLGLGMAAAYLSTGGIALTSDLTFDLTSDLTSDLTE